MLLRREKTAFIFLVLLVLAVGLSPRIPVGGRISGGGFWGGSRQIEIRAEDVILAVFILLAAVAFLLSGKEKIEKPPLFIIIVLWLSLGFASLLLNWILGNISLAVGFFTSSKKSSFFFFIFLFITIFEILNRPSSL